LDEPNFYTVLTQSFCIRITRFWQLINSLFLGISIWNKNWRRYRNQLAESVAQLFYTNTAKCRFEISLLQNKQLALKSKCQNSPINIQFTNLPSNIKQQLKIVKTPKTSSIFIIFTLYFMSIHEFQKKMDSFQSNFDLLKKMNSYQFSDVTCLLDGPRNNCG
jgi:hypothetical protein